MNKLKLKLMLYALNNDYFGYGTLIDYQKGVYTIYAEGEVYELTPQELSNDFDNLDKNTKLSIIADYSNDNLL